MAWRRTLLVLHRDVGFFALGLTLVYGVSGLAVNPRGDWDYNASSALTRHAVGSPAELLGLEADGVAPGALARAEQARLVTTLARLSERSEAPTKVMWRSPGRLSLLYGEGGRDVVDYLPESGVLELERRRPRPLLRQLNFLHLNEGRSFWTYVADLYALALVFLGVSGVLVVRGRRGLGGRGGLYALAGVVVPLVAYWLLV